MIAERKAWIALRRSRYRFLRASLVCRSSSSAELQYPVISIRFRLIGRARWLSRLARREGLWAGRALHSPSRPQSRAAARRSRIARQRPQRSISARRSGAMLVAGAARSNAASSRTPPGISLSVGRRWRVPSAAAARRASPRSQQYAGRAWTACEPASYRADEIADGWHAARRPLPTCRASSQKPLRSPARCLCKRVAGRAPSGTTVDTIAEFLLGCANLGQERDGIERAILIT